MIACRRYQNGFAMQAKAIVTRNANADKCGIIAQEKINSSPSWQKARVAAISQPTHSNAFSWMIFFFFFIIKISMKFVPKCPIGNEPALVQVMAWRRTGHKPLPGPMMTQSIDYMWH